MNQNEIFEIMDRFEKSGIAKFEYELNGERLTLEKAVYTPSQPQAQQLPQMQPEPVYTLQEAHAAPVEVESKTAVDLTAPLVGVFYEASTPGANPFVKVGDKVNKGQLLCLIEAMKMINELPSPINGVIKSILVQNEDVVSFGQKLFEIEPC